MKTTGLPRKVRVGPFDITIKIESLAWAIENKRWGEFDSNRQIITIQCEFPNRGKLIDTVLHEISHAIYWAYGILDEDKEERVVSAFGTAWTQVWQDNPKLFRWMMATLKGSRSANALR